MSKKKEDVTIARESDEETDDDIDIDDVDADGEDAVDVEEEEDEDEGDVPLGDLANPDKKDPNARMHRTPQPDAADSEESVGSPAIHNPSARAVEGPSPGYSSIEEEKADLLFKMDRLRKKGMTVRVMDFTNSISDIRLEAARIRNEIELENSLNFSKKMLMAVVSTMEFLNKKYDPFDLALDGWSESVMESVDSYDSVLEKLYYKYRNRVAMPPEMELLLSLAGSAFMFHMTNSIFKKATLGGSNNNPDLLKSMMSAFSNAAKQPPPPPQQQQPPPQQQQSSYPNYEMKGPSMDFGPMMGMMSGMMGGMPPQQQQPIYQQPPQQQQPIYQPPQMPIDTRSKPSSAIEVRTKDTPMFLPEPSPMVTQKKPVSVKKKNKVEVEVDDRLSDIISEDLESLSDISDMSSPASSVKQVVIRDRPKGGKGKTISL